MKRKIGRHLANNGLKEQVISICNRRLASTESHFVPEIWWKCTVAFWNWGRIYLDAILCHQHESGSEMNMNIKTSLRKTKLKTTSSGSATILVGNCTRAFIQLLFISVRLIQKNLQMVRAPYHLVNRQQVYIYIYNVQKCTVWHFSTFWTREGIKKQLWKKICISVQ